MVKSRMNFLITFYPSEDIYNKLHTFIMSIFPNHKFCLGHGDIDFIKTEEFFNKFGKNCSMIFIENTRTKTNEIKFITNINQISSKKYKTIEFKDEMYQIDMLH